MTPEVNQTKTRLSQAFLWRTISFFWDYFCWLIKFHLFLWNFCLTSTLWCKKKVSTQWLGPAMIHSFCCLKLFVISDEFSIVRGNYLILLHCLITANNENVCQSCYIFDGMRWNCFFKRLSLKSVSKKNPFSGSQFGSSQGFAQFRRFERNVAEGSACHQFLCVVSFNRPRLQIPHTRSASTLNHTNVH